MFKFSTKQSKLFVVAIGVTAFTLFLASCGTTEKASESDSATPNLTIAMITHETPGDTYWDIIRAGANAAAKHLGVTLKYSSDPDFTKQATLVQNAIDSKVDGIALTAASPDALTEAVKAAKAAKIPVTMFDSGIDDYLRLGAEQYFGSDEYVAGQALGKTIAKAGGKHALCVIHQEGSTALEARCKGVGEGLKSTNMQVNGTDDASMNASITAKLQQDKSIDWVVTMGAPVALVVVQSIATAGSKAKIGTFDLNLDAAKAIKEGTIAIAVDAQPYAQGYMAVISLWLYITNGNDLGGGKAVLTGPSMVDASNIDKILPYAQKGTR